MCSSPSNYHDVGEGGAGLALAGGAVAAVALLLRRRSTLWALLAWALLYATFVLYVMFS